MTDPASTNMSAVRLDEIIDQLGPESPDVNCVAATGHEMWAVQCDNGAIAHLTRRDAPRRLELMAEVASLHAGTSMKAMRALLMFNFLSVDTGGLRMGLSAVDDAVFLIRDIPEADLSLAVLQGALRELVDLAAKWALIMDSCDECSPEDLAAFGQSTGAAVVTFVRSPESAPSDWYVHAPQADVTRTQLAQQLQFVMALPMLGFDELMISGQPLQYRAT
jgi:hypothetical protein